MKRLITCLALFSISLGAWAADPASEATLPVLKPAEIKSAEEVLKSAEPKKATKKKTPAVDAAATTDAPQTNDTKTNDTKKTAKKKNTEDATATTRPSGDEVKKTAKKKNAEDVTATTKPGSDEVKKTAKKKKADDATAATDAKTGEAVKKSAKAKKDKGAVEAKKGEDAKKPANLTPATIVTVKSPVDEVVDKHAQARGGLQAWRNTQTLTFAGQMDAGGKNNPQLPFMMKVKRAHKSRLELTFNGQVAVQVYDGMNGWKLRPFLNRTDAEPYTPMEKKLAASLDDLDGPLIDYAKKGTRISMEKNEPVDGHDAIKLKLTMKDGTERRVWLDAKTYLEIKTDGQPRILDGKPHKVAVFYRDYRPDNGLMLPHILETVVEGVKESHKMVIQNVAVNQPMDDALFAKPQLTALATTSGK